MDNKPEDVVKKLNLEILPQSAWDKHTVFEYSSNGIADGILFDGIPLWDSENGDRYTYDTNPTPALILKTLVRYTGEVNDMLMQIVEEAEASEQD